MKTTHEVAKEKLHNNIVNSLQGLLEKNYDAEAGYKKAMLKAENSAVTDFFKSCAILRGRFVNELNHEIRSMNESPKESGSTAAAVHRMWIDFKTVLSGNNDEAILEECIRGEKASVEEYEKTLENQNFSPELTQLLTNQKSRIENALKTVKDLEFIAS
jgi:uncharacterized protein (TIGR02284 family)